MTMTWLLSTDEEPNPKQTNQAVNLKEDTLMDEETVKQDPDSTKEDEAQVAETGITQTKTATTATFANIKVIDRRNAGKG
jgi:hypothetical protein